MIPWYIFAFLTAIFWGVAVILRKKALTTQRTPEFSTGVMVIMFLMSLFLLPLADFSTLNLKLIAWIYFGSLFGASGFLLINRGLRHSQISIIAPLVNYGPMLTAIVAFVFLREKLSLMQVFGIALLMIGAYALELDLKTKSIFSPFKKIFGSKYILLFLLGSVFYACSATVERYYLISNVTPITAIILVHLFLSFNFLIYMSFKEKGLRKVFGGLHKYKWILFFVALFMLSARVMQYFAIQLTTAVALVAALKRTGSLIPTIVGGKFFHEDGVLRKSLACIILIGGAVLIVVF